MMSRNTKQFGVTKIQKSLALLILVVEVLAPSQVVQAAGLLDQKLVITAPAKSVIELSDEQKLAYQKERQERLSVKKPVDVIYMQVSAYNSIPNQTDGSPYLTAIGSFTRDGVVASNYLQIGTRIRFPDVFGDKEFRVEDRMNTRYNKVVDIWMEDIKDARKFGRRNLKVEIIEYGKGRGRD